MVLIGILTGWSLLAAALWWMGANAAAVLFNPPALAIVLGGTLAAMLASVRFDTLLNLVRTVPRLFRGNPRLDTAYAATRLITLSHRAAEASIFALEREADAESDPYLALGLNLLLRNTLPERIERRYAIELESLRARHARSIRLFGILARLALSFGLAGALIGLIPMLPDLAAGLVPDPLGARLALATSAPLDGALLALLVFLPAAERLREATAREQAHLVMVRDGIRMIQDGYTPREIEQLLNARLPPRQRRSIVDVLVMQSGHADD